METTFESKVEILADLWMNYRGDEEFDDFFEYNDLGLPLSYAVANKIVKSTENSQSMIDETFSLFLAGLDIEDEGFTHLDEILGL
tara:strand:+ start:178 stop:432 length:255 start_codon:yes stop_codon:yes gene_type:complete